MVDTERNYQAPVCSTAKEDLLFVYDQMKRKFGFDEDHDGFDECYGKEVKVDVMVEIVFVGRSKEQGRID